MANNIKGLTVEIGGNTTKLDKALEDVKKKSTNLSGELREVNRLLSFDPGNADLLAQKQQILAEAIENTADRLKILKEAERQVQAQFERGEVSAEQVRALQREITQTEQVMSRYQSAARETAESMEHIGEAAEEAEEASDDLSATLSDMASTGLKAVGTIVGAAVTGLTAAAESTREYRTEMAKLNTAFTDNGFTVEEATGAYKELQGILGETDQAVEAANHLAKLTDNEKELATWTGDILPGVFATFGASLPIEGLTEAANETAKVGQVTGPLADALNWAGISEDAFNESLAKCTSEQERQALITETLAGLYGEASAAYKETNADVIAANQANEAWTASMARVGAAVEPLLTQVKNMGAALLTNVTPVIEGILNNLPTVGVILAGITASLIAFKVAAIAAAAAQNGMTLAATAAATAQKVLNAVMSANPIGLIILAITGLVAAFVYLWQNCEEFREFWIDLWAKIQEKVAAAVEFFKTLPEAIYNAISGAVARVQQWGTDMVTKAKTAASNFLTNVTSTLKKIPGNIANAISGAISRVATWGSNMVSKAKTAASNFLSNVASNLKKIPSNVWSAISGAIDRVATWGSNMVTKAKTAMRNVVTSVTSTLKELPGKVLSIGGDLVSGLWNGVNDKLSWLKGKIKSFTSSVLSSIKDFFGVHSPSTETAWIGDMLDQGLAEGMLDNMKRPINAMKTVTGGVLDAAQDINGVSLNRQLQRTPSPSTIAAAAANGGMLEKLDKILAAIERGQILTIDSKTFVGGTADLYDSTLGQRRALVARGAL